jgi:hypothetical protein
MWLINITISLSSFAHESDRVAIGKRFAKFLQVPGKIFERGDEATSIKI